MAILKIYQYPAPILRQKAIPVTEFTEETVQLISDMAETMWDAPGIGLAAPQIGKSLQLIVVDISNKSENADENDDTEKEYMVLINPEIVSHEGTQEDTEGCLSLPELSSGVQRYKKIVVQYQDKEGKRCELTAEDRFAVVLQHEIDHLHGILFLDHLSHLKRTLYKKKVKKWLKA